MPGFDAIDVQMDSPIRNKRRSTTRDSDEPTPKMRLESAPIATVDEIEIEDKENNHLSQQKSCSSNSLDFDLDSEDSLEEAEMEPAPSEGTPNFVNRKKLRRSVSLPQLADLPPKPSTPATPVSNFDKSRCSSVFDLYSSPVRITKRYRDAVDKRPHHFGARRIFTKMFCMICKESFRFGGEITRCKVCKFTCHPKCQEKLTKACIPFKDVPKASNGRLKLVDYCSDTRPRLPHPVLRCVTALDGMLDSMDLYITDVDAETVKTFCSDLVYSKHFSNFSGYSAKLVSQALLKFLSELREPVILKTSSDEFLSACENPENTELESVIVDLPKPHRNTLAYLCLHFKRVLGTSHINGLTTFKLAPKIISVLMRVNFDKANTEKYVDAFTRLVSLDNSFYERVIEEDSQEPNTPVSRSGSRNYVYDKLARSVTMSQMPNMPFQRMNFF